MFSLLPVDRDRILLPTRSPSYDITLPDLATLAISLRLQFQSSLDFHHDTCSQRGGPEISATCSATKGKGRRSLSLLVSAYRLSFLCCPPSFPLAGGGVQRIVDSRFDSVELGTLAGRYETLPCSKLSLSLSTESIPISFLCSFQPVPTWETLHILPHPQLPATSSFLFTFNGKWFNQAGFPVVASSPQEGPHSHGPSHHGPLDAASWCSLGFFPPEPLGWRPPFKPHHPRYQSMAPNWPPKLPVRLSPLCIHKFARLSPSLESLPMFGARLTKAPPPHFLSILHSQTLN